METYVVWPNLWLTAAFIAACVVLIVTVVGREKMSKAGNLMLGVLTSSCSQWIISLLLLLGGFIVTLCLLHLSDVGVEVYIGYIIVALLFPFIVVALLSDFGGCISIWTCLLGYAAGQSVIGLIFLVCCHFSYMWYLLGLLVLDIVGIVLAELNDD